jgi:hypothetical protein
MHRANPSYRSTATALGSAALMGDPRIAPLEADDYVAVGLALCFVMQGNKPVGELMLKVTPADGQCSTCVCA